MPKDYTMYVVLAGVGIGGYLLYRKMQECQPGDTGLCSVYNSIFGPPVVTQVVPPYVAPVVTVLPAAPVAPVAPAVVVTPAPVAPSALTGPALNLRDSLVAAWLGSQGKGWDASAAPTLKISDWDVLFNGYISPSSATVGGSTSVTADDYVRARVAKSVGLSGFGCSRIPMGAIHGLGYRLWRAG